MTDTLHIYTRVSTRVQDEEGTSLTTQKELGIAKSKELKMKHKVWNEGAASSHHEDLLNRPVLAQLLLDMEQGEIKHLFVFNNDRLSRNEDTQFVIKSALRRNDVLLYTKDGQFDLNNPQDKLFKSLLDSVAEYDNALRAERSRLGKINRVRQGYWYGAPPPYGYKIVEGKLTPNPVESKWVKKMFRWFKEGQSIVWIKSQLDKEGVLARRGKLFTTGSINVLLQNTHHIGHYNWTDKKSGETIPCPCPAIVDETVWNEVQRRREQIFSRKGQNNRTKRFYLLRNLMFCGECGSQMSGRIHDARNERIYFCPNKTRNWVKGVIPQDQKWKRGKVDNHGCDMNRSLNIPITDKFVWDTVMDAVSKSSTLKEGFKEEILHSKYAGDAETDRELKNLKTKSNRLKKDLQQVQSSIADVETNHLLKRYDDVVYSQIKSNLDAELKTKKDEIEQTRIRIKELGNERRWLDWVEKYADRVGSLEDFSNEDKKEYLEGILRRIDVSLDKETNDHHLDLTFNLGLVDDGVEYSNTGDKSVGYKVVEGSTNASTVIPYTETQNRHKDARRTGRQEQSAIDLKKNCNVSDRNAKCDEGLTTYHRSPSFRHGGMSAAGADSVFPAAHPELREGVRALCEKFPGEYWREKDRERAYPEEFVAALTQAGYLAALIPEEFGGSGLGIAEAAAILEEVHASGCNGAACHAQMYIMGTLLRHGADELKVRYLPDIASGALRLQAFGVTEPTSGSDTTRLRTKAERRGDVYVVNGQKIWTSRIEHSDLMLLLARTTPMDKVAKRTEGLSVFLVDLRDAVGKGLTIRPIRTMINHATTEVFFDGLEVPAGNLVGEEGQGFRHILDGMNAERVLIASECIGDARWFIDRARAYANERVVFERPIGQNQGVQFPIAKAYAQARAAALMVREAAALFDAGAPCGAEANMAKLLASEASWAAADMCLQTFGGFGFAEEYDIERKFRETRLMQVAPISTNMVLAYLAEHVLGLPRSY